MDKLKFLFRQTMMISFGMLIGLSVEGMYYQNDFHLEWYHPLTIVIAGAICSLPSLLLLTTRELPTAKYRMRIGLHFLFLFLLVMGIGYLFKWYRYLGGALFVACIFVFVYIFVWVVNSWMGKRNQESINAVLDQIRDEE